MNAFFTNKPEPVAPKSKCVKRVALTIKKSNGGLLSYEYVTCENGASFLVIRDKDSNPTGALPIKALSLRARSRIIWEAYNAGSSEIACTIMDDPTPRPCTIS